MEVGPVLAGEDLVVLGPTTTDNCKDTGAGFGHCGLHSDDLAIEVHYFNRKASNAALGVAPLSESDCCVPKLCEEAVADLRASLVADTQIQLVRTATGLACLYFAVTFAARRVHGSKLRGGACDRVAAVCARRTSGSGLSVHLLLSLFRILSGAAGRQCNESYNTCQYASTHHSPWNQI